MNKNYTVFLLLSMLGAHWAYGMDQQITFKSNQKEGFPQAVTNIVGNSTFKNIAAEFFVFNQEKCIKEFQKAQKRGVKVDLTVGPHYQNKQALSSISDIRKNKDDHGKIICALDSSPSSNKKPKNGILIFGSPNLSNMTWPWDTGKKQVYNFESWLEIKDLLLASEAYNMVKSQPPMKPENEKKIIETTPKKAKFYGSHDTTFNPSIALRLKNFAQLEDPNKKARIQTMNFNDEEIAQAIINLGESVDLIVHDSALTRNGIPLLDKISDSGADVSVFRTPKDSRAIHHIKKIDLISEAHNKYTHTTLTSNLTTTEQRNYMMFVPNNKKVTTDSAANFDIIKTKCTPYKEAKNSKQEEDDALKKMKKRKRNDTNKNKKTKKQKTKK